MTSAVIEKSTEHQLRARMALSAALASGPSHAYFFRGPRGAGKSLVARAFSAEILATGAADPDDARRRALLDPSPHPDLVWLAPRGAQHMVEEVREKVIRSASYRPFEGEKRVFVIEAAEAMRDESQNALLKTLEEPPDFVHLILLTAEPSMLLETIASRCQPIDFAPLPVEAVEAALGDVGPAGRSSRRCPPFRRRPLPRPLPPLGLWPHASCRSARNGQGRRGGFAGHSARKRVRRMPPGAAAAEPTLDATDRSRRISRRRSRRVDPRSSSRRNLKPESSAPPKDITDEAKRAGRRRRTEILDLGLELSAGWFRDLAAVASRRPRGRLQPRPSR